MVIDCDRYTVSYWSIIRVIIGILVMQVLCYLCHIQVTKVLLMSGSVLLSAVIILGVTRFHPILLLGYLSMSVLGVTLILLLVDIKLLGSSS